MWLCPGIPERRTPSKHIRCQIRMGGFSASSLGSHLSAKFAVHVSVALDTSIALCVGGRQHVVLASPLGYSGQIAPCNKVTV